MKGRQQTFLACSRQIKKNKQQQPHDHHETFAVHFYTTEEQYIHYTVHINSSINETSSFRSNFKVAWPIDHEQ